MMCNRPRLSNIKPYSLETKIHISLINSYAPKVHSFFLRILANAPCERWRFTRGFERWYKKFVCDNIILCSTV